MVMEPYLAERRAGEYKGILESSSLADKWPEVHTKHQPCESLSKLLSPASLGLFSLVCSSLSHGLGHFYPCHHKSLKGMACIDTAQSKACWTQL